MESLVWFVGLGKVSGRRKSSKMEGFGEVGFGGWVEFFLIRLG